jgi:hypothetical protein
MEIVMLMNRLLDILLFPKDLYKRITDRKPSLYAGIIFVGLADLGFVLYKNFNELFTNKTQGDLIFNIILSILFVIVIGIIDVFFFSLPLFDLFKRFKKDKNLPQNRGITDIKDSGIKDRDIRDKGLLIKLIKVYIVTHFLILPAEIVVFLIYRNIINNTGIATWVMYISVIIDLLIPIWFSAAISRGVNVLYDFKPVFKRLAFVIIFVWNHLLAYAFSYMIDKWMLVLFR